MKQYLVYFDKVLQETSGGHSLNDKFTGTIIIEAETKPKATAEFLDWIKNHDKFQDCEKFFFEIKEIDHQL